ncbi:TPA: hypothetical protein DIV55_00690, partial [Patescibacteria group bacterium]|nr:hypothetical protein [Patescibacteria group bacterium]
MPTSVENIGNVSPDRLSSELFNRNQMVKFGDMRLLLTTWGDLITVYEYENILEYRGQLTQNNLEMIENSGFTHNYRWPDHVDLFSEEMQNRHIQFAVAMSKQLMKARDWKGVTFLDIGSLTSWPNIAEETAKRLRKDGYGVEETESNNFACFEGFDSIVRRAKDPNYYDTQGLTLVVESLSGQPFSPDKHRTHFKT